MLPPRLLDEAKEFINILKSNPDLLHSPDLKFLQDYLKSLGAKLPPKSEAKSPSRPVVTECSSGASSAEEESEPESEESELELDKSNVIQPESDAPQSMGDDSKEVTDEMSDKADEKRTEAQSRFSDGDFEQSVVLFTEAIECNPKMALCFAKRAAAYVKLKKPSAAIRDCDKAISLNPDSAASYKWRGFANKLLGNWEAAYLDLQTSLRLDYSDDANAAMKEIEPTYKRIHEHRLKWDRKREDRKYSDLQKARRVRQRAYEKAKKDEAKGSETYGMPGGMSGGMPSGMPGGMPSGMPGGMPSGMPGGMPGMDQLFGNLFSDPEMMAAMKDPEIRSAFAAGMSDPAAFAKASSNPKFQKVMKKMQEKMAGAGGAKFTPTDGANTPAGDDLD